jgi:hypothetical protein
VRTYNTVSSENEKRKPQEQKRSERASATTSIKSTRRRKGKRWYGAEKLIAPPSTRPTSCCERFGFLGFDDGGGFREKA